MPASRMAWGQLLRPALLIPSRAKTVSPAARRDPPPPSHGRPPFRRLPRRSAAPGRRRGPEADPDRRPLGHPSPLVLPSLRPLYDVATHVYVP